MAGHVCIPDELGKDEIGTWAASRSLHLTGGRELTRRCPIGGGIPEKHCSRNLRFPDVPARRQVARRSAGAATSLTCRKAVGSTRSAGVPSAFTLDDAPRKCSRSPPRSTQKTLDDLFLHTLKDIYYAEKQILKALPKLAKGAELDELKAAFQTHREQTALLQ